MVQGTMSNAGKSLLTAGLCRIFKQDGYKVAPFKSQNMALNSFITEEGLEMGRAQVAQAEAAGREPDVRMNPVLLTPSSDTGSQLSVNGEVRGQYRAAEYFKMKKSLVPEILRRLGYKHIICEPEQMKIDGDFPTVKNPNPEYKEGFNLAIELARRNDVDLIIGTDPDADRTGIVLKDKTGDYVTLSGNQVGVLLIDYIITARKLTNTMPAHPAVLKSIVTTEMARAAAEKNGVACFDTFTGFKFLAEKIKQFEKTGSHKYLFAFEESYGYLAGDYARDKDAVTASMLIAEMAAYYRTQGKTLYDAMEEMYEKYGYYCEQTISITMPGVSGLQRMKELMAELREKPLTQIGPDKVEYTRDYQPGTRTCMADGKAEEMELKGQNVMYYELEGGTMFIIRPSGTEPKVKVYIMAKGDSKADAAAKVDALAAAAKEIVK